MDPIDYSHLELPPHGCSEHRLSHENASLFSLVCPEPCFSNMEVPPLMMTKPFLPLYESMEDILSLTTLIDCDLFEMEEEDPLMTAQIVETPANVDSLLEDPILLPLVDDDPPRVTSEKLDASFQSSRKRVFEACGNQPRFREFHAGQWQQRFNELSDYKQAYGDCLVPHHYPNNPMLGRWVKRQRYQYKLMVDGGRSAMTPERALALENIGFVWDSQSEGWDERLEDLKAYKARNGHCNVPSSCKKHPQLATWTKCQRRQYKLYCQGQPSHMTQERMHQLETIGFQWTIRRAKKMCLSMKILQ